MQIYEIMRNAALGVVLMVFLPLVLHNGINVIKPEPERNSSEHSQYETFYFLSALVFSIACIAIGAWLKGDFIGTGFILGGVICLILGYLHGLRLSDMLKFVTALGGLSFVLLLEFIVGRKYR